VRDRGEESETLSIGSDWCIIGLPNSSLYSYGRPGFLPLRWPSWPSGLLNKARSTAPTRPRRPQIKFMSTNHNSQHLTPGIGRVTKRLPISVILSHHPEHH